MKTIIAGSRDIVDLSVVEKAMSQCGWQPTEVVSGTARGVDVLGEVWAGVHNIPIKRFPADWNRFGKRAGYVRNVQMAEYAEALVAVWDGISKGTEHMINIAQEKGLVVFVFRIPAK